MTSKEVLELCREQDVKVVDFYAHGRSTAAHRRDDVADLVRILYDAVGGPRHYASQPPEIKAICKGLRRDLIGKAFPTARHLREHLETFVWQERPKGRKGRRKGGR